MPATNNPEQSHFSPQRRRTKSEGEPPPDQKPVQIKQRSTTTIGTQQPYHNKQNDTKHQVKHQKNDNRYPHHHHHHHHHQQQHYPKHQQQNQHKNQKGNQQNRPNPPREHRKMVRHANNPTKIAQSKYSKEKSDSKDESSKDDPTSSTVSIETEQPVVSTEADKEVESSVSVTVIDEKPVTERDLTEGVVTNDESTAAIVESTVVLEDKNKNKIKDLKDVSSTNGPSIENDVILDSKPKDSLVEETKEISSLQETN